MKVWHRLAGILRRGPQPPAGGAAEAPARPASRMPTAADRAATRRAAADLHQAEAEAAYARERLDLYRARTLTGRDASQARLRELEREAVAADARLAHLRAAGRGDVPAR